MLRSVFLLLGFLLAGTSSVYSQLEYSKWVMSQGIEVDFEFTPPKVTRTNAMSVEGSSSVYNNSQGQIVFYASGERIYNNDHSVMENGIGLFSSSQPSSAALIVPHPTLDSVFFLFGTAANGEQGGLVYHVVEPYYYGWGNGKVTSTNVELMDRCLEKVAAIKKIDEPGYWVVAHELGNATFRVFEVTPYGVSVPVDSIHYQEIGSEYAETGVGVIGQLKFSPDGKMLASVIRKEDVGGVDLFNFDLKTGHISNYRQVPGDRWWFDYGVEFSDSSETMFLGSANHADSKIFEVYGYNVSPTVTTADLAQSETMLGTLSFGRAYNRGPDSKIYIFPNGDDHLAVIENPNSLSTASLKPVSDINFNIYTNNNATVKRAGCSFTMGLDWPDVPYDGPSYRGEWEVPPGPIYAYDYVSPNGDGLNDFFHVDNIEHYRNSKVKIFTTQGQLIFEKEDYENDWPQERRDGGVYVFRIELENGEVHNGSFTLVE